MPNVCKGGLYREGGRDVIPLSQMPPFYTRREWGGEVCGKKFVSPHFRIFDIKINAVFGMEFSLVLLFKNLEDIALDLFKFTSIFDVFGNVNILYFIFNVK